MFLAIKKKKKKSSIERRENFLTLICRFDSRKPSANKGKVSELQLSVF
jgi:hypothetical protein